jgi:hypothetical protein
VVNFALPSSAVADVLFFWRKRRSDGGREDFDVFGVVGALVAEEVLRESAVDDAVVRDVDELLRCDVM